MSRTPSENTSRAALQLGEIGLYGLQSTLRPSGLVCRRGKGGPDNSKPLLATLPWPMPLVGRGHLPDTPSVWQLTVLTLFQFTTASPIPRMGRIVETPSTPTPGSMRPPGTPVPPSEARRVSQAQRSPRTHAREPGCISEDEVPKASETYTRVSVPPGLGAVLDLSPADTCCSGSLPASASGSGIIKRPGISLVAQGLRLHNPNTGATSSIPSRRSHMPQLRSGAVAK